MPTKDAQLSTASKVVTTDSSGNLVSTIGYGTSGNSVLLQTTSDGKLPAISGENLTNLPSSGRVTKVKTSPETVNNSVALQNDNDFFFSIGANETWTVTIDMGFTTGTTPDFKFDFLVPAGCAATASMQFFTQTGTSDYYPIADATSAQAILITGAGELRGYIMAVITNGATAGTAQLRWAQNTADPSDTTIVTGSFMRAVRV